MYGTSDLACVLASSCNYPPSARKKEHISGACSGILKASRPFRPVLRENAASPGPETVYLEPAIPPVPLSRPAALPARQRIGNTYIDSVVAVLIVRIRPGPESESHIKNLAESVVHLARLMQKYYRPDMPRPVRHAHPQTLQKHNPFPGLYSEHHGM